MQRYKENIPRLLANFIMNKQSDQENKELDEWLQSKSNQSLFDRLSDKNKILKKSFDYDQYEVDKAWNKFEKKLDAKFEKKINKKASFNYRTWLAYASVIVLPIALALFVYIEAPKYSDLVVQQQIIPPGESNAIIYLADGSHVNLKNDTSSVIKGKDNLVVEKENNVLKVNADNLKTQDLSRMNKIVTPVSGEYQLVLPDGTKVWLNADSYLEFPSKFSSKYRKVIAKGELYFDVASNKDWPFIVESNGMELKVLGTEFNLRSYTDEENIVSTLVEGSVEIRNTKGDALLLSPGRKAILNRTDLSMSEDKADIKAITAWKNGKFIFEDERIEEIMHYMSRWYEINVFFDSPEVKRKRFSLDIPRYATVNEILDLLEATGEISFEVNNKIIRVSK